MNPNLNANPRPIAILVVDDSPSVRKALRAMIEAEPGLVVTEAADPYEAVALMRQTAPDAIILDVDMPRMDGLTFLEKLMRQHPLPVILCTDHARRGLKALELGALEVIAKPDWHDADGLDAWAARLRESLRLAVGVARPQSKPRERDDPWRDAGTRHEAEAILPRRPYVPHSSPGPRIVAIGASTGGVQAIARLLADFSADCPGMVIVQHMPPGFTAAFAERLDLDPKIAPKVIEAGQNEPVRPGVALIVPGHAHGLIRRAGGGYRVELVDGPPVCRHRPSVDVLFRSAAQAAGPRAAGVLLTGMGDDGARGLVEMHESGGLTIAQDEATSVVFGMPREAIRRGAAKLIRPLPKIAETVQDWAKAP